MLHDCLPDNGRLLSRFNSNQLLIIARVHGPKPTRSRPTGSNPTLNSRSERASGMRTADCRSAVINVSGSSINRRYTTRPMLRHQKIFIRHCHAVMMALLTCFYNDIIITYHFCCTTHLSVGLSRDLRSFVIRFDFESYVRLEIRFVLMVRFEIFESSALSIVIRKETINGG